LHAHERNAYRVEIGKRERTRWEDNLSIDLKEI
jgi:hypothetical protein